MNAALPNDDTTHVYYDRVIYCARCGYPVENEMAKLDSRVFHVNCFTCDRCEVPLAGKSVHTQDNKKYDEECFAQVSSKRCDICEQAILGDNEKYIIAKGKTYHTNCYVCSQCGTSLRKNRHTVQGKKRICQACVNANRINPCGAVGRGSAFGGGSAFGAAPKVNADVSEEL